ncbi:MAG TPA: hypothetical protein VN452_02365 [Longilinea sp.]|nr:hypothetical protein [Longilinea sp.]
MNQSTGLPLPEKVIHADWSRRAEKRWAAAATLRTDGSYYIENIDPIKCPRTLLDEIKQKEKNQTLWIGFDFPIGLPLAYARRIGCQFFPDFLTQLALAEWQSFFDPAKLAGEISLTRPFYPDRPGSTRQAHLIDALGLPDKDSLRRRCERAQPGRRAASPLFWTMGAQQVGKAALNGWCNILLPAVADGVAVIWPFSGELAPLLATPTTILAETYPAEYYAGLGITLKGSKRSQSVRKLQAMQILGNASSVELTISNDLRQCIESGFGDGVEGEDVFDALVGLLGMLQVLRVIRPCETPDDPDIRRIEGWILGQKPPIIGKADQASIGIMT